MSNTLTVTNGQSEQLAFRVEPVVAQRVDRLAAYGGVGRSEFLRLSVAYLDSKLTANELQRLEAAGAVPPKAAETKQEAEETMARIEARLVPKPIVVV
jgi:metal-responsive CopG/Arc/MetJ family transcriptional regulator